MEVEEELAIEKRRTLSFASLLPRRLILLRWKDASPFTHAQWLEDITSCLKLEKVRYSLQQLSGKFQRVWGPFLNAFHTLKTWPLGAA